MVKKLVQCTVYSVQCTVYSVHCTVYSVYTVAVIGEIVDDLQKLDLAGLATYNNYCID